MYLGFIFWFCLVFILDLEFFGLFMFKSFLSSFILLASESVTVFHFNFLFSLLRTGSLFLLSVLQYLSIYCFYMSPSTPFWCDLFLFV